MPAAYEQMRDHFIREGLKSKAAKTKAAKSYNARRAPGIAPVTGPSHGDNRDNRANTDNRGFGD